MIKTIEIAGAEHPISFSQAFPYHFERVTGKKYLAEIRQLLNEFNAVAQSPDMDVAEAAEKVSVVRIADLLFAALSNGYREANKRFDFDVYKVAEWIGTDQNSVTLFINALVESLPQPKTDGEQTDGEEKKQEAPTQSTGKN